MTTWDSQPTEEECWACSGYGVAYGPVEDGERQWWRCPWCRGTGVLYDGTHEQGQGCACHMGEDYVPGDQLGQLHQQRPARAALVALLRSHQPRPGDRREPVMFLESVPMFPGLGEVMSERMAEMREAGATDEQIRDEIAWVTDIVRRTREEHRIREGWYA